MKTIYETMKTTYTPRDSYGAITAAAAAGDVSGLRRLLRLCPDEYYGRRDAMVTAARRGDETILQLVLSQHEGEEATAAQAAEAAGHVHVVHLLRRVLLLRGKEELGQ